MNTTDIPDDDLMATMQLDAALDSARDGAHALEILQAFNMKDVQAVNLNSKNLSATDLPALGLALQRATQLKMLAMSQNLLGEGTATLVADLLQSGIPLRILTLDGCGLNAASMTLLGKALKASELAGLSLDDNVLTQDGFKALCAGLPASLRFLSLSETAAGAGGVAALVQAFTERRCPNLEQMALRHCNVDDASAAALIGVLPLTLTELDMGGNTLGQKAAEALAKALPNGEVAVLLLQDNSINDVAAQVLAEAIMGSALRVVNLANNMVSTPGAKAIAAALPHSDLKVLDLSQNDLAGAGGAALFTELAKASVESFSCASAALDASLVPVLAHGLPSTCLEALDLADNDLGDTLCVALAQMAPRLRLQALRLDNNGITAHGAQALAAVAAQAPLRIVSFADNAIDDVGALALAEAFGAIEGAVCNLEGNPLTAEAVARMQALNERYEEDDGALS